MRLLSPAALLLVCLGLRSVAAYTAAGRVGMSATLIGQSIYIYGGTIDVANPGIGTQDLLILDASVSFDTSAPAWAPNTGPSLAGPPLTWHSGASGGPNNTYLIIFGGVIAQPTPLHIYDTVNNIWSSPTIEGAPSNRDWSMALTRLQDGKMFLYGGYANSEDLGDLFLYDSVASTWSQLSDGPAPRYGHSATMLRDGTIVIIGGANVDDSLIPLATVLVYDTIGASWSTKNTTSSIQFPYSRKYHSAVVNFLDHIIVYGGRNESDVPLDEVWVLDMSFDIPSWWVPGLNGTTIPVARSFHAAVMAGVNMLVFFGETANSVLDQNVYILNTQTWFWSTQYNPIHLEYTPTLPQANTISNNTNGTRVPNFFSPSISIPSGPTNNDSQNSTAIIAGVTSACVVVVVAVIFLVIFCNRKLSIEAGKREAALNDIMEARISRQSMAGMDIFGQGNMVERTSAMYSGSQRQSIQDQSFTAPTEFIIKNSPPPTSRITGDVLFQYYKKGPENYSGSENPIIENRLSSPLRTPTPPPPPPLSPRISTDKGDLEQWRSYPIRQSLPPMSTSSAKQRSEPSNRSRSDHSDHDSLSGSTMVPTERADSVTSDPSLTRSPYLGGRDLSGSDNTVNPFVGSMESVHLYSSSPPSIPPPIPPPHRVPPAVPEVDRNQNLTGGARQTAYVALTGEEGGPFEDGKYDEEEE